MPGIWLTRQWVDYLAWFRGVVTSHTGIVSAEELPLGQWPYRLFAQEWTYPALSVAACATRPGRRSSWRPTTTSHAVRSHAGRCRMPRRACGTRACGSEALPPGNALAR